MAAAATMTIAKTAMEAVVTNMALGAETTAVKKDAATEAGVTNTPVAAAQEATADKSPPSMAMGATNSSGLGNALNFQGSGAQADFDGAMSQARQHGSGYDSEEGMFSSVLSYLKGNQDSIGQGGLMRERWLGRIGGCMVGGRVVTMEMEKGGMGGKKGCK